VAGGLRGVVKDERQHPSGRGPGHSAAMDKAGREDAGLPSVQMQAGFRSLEALLTRYDVEDLWTGMSVDYRRSHGHLRLENR
jgi:hypothetical protein